MRAGNLRDLEPTFESDSCLSHGVSSQVGVNGEGGKPSDFAKYRIERTYNHRYSRAFGTRCVGQTCDE